MRTSNAFSIVGRSKSAEVVECFKSLFVSHEHYKRCFNFADHMM